MFTLVKRTNYPSIQFQGISIPTVLEVKYPDITLNKKTDLRPSPSIKRKIFQKSITFTLSSD